MFQNSVQKKMILGNLKQQFNNHYHNQSFDTCNIDEDQALEAIAGTQRVCSSCWVNGRARRRKRSVERAPAPL